MIISPTVHTAGIAGLELAVNRALQLDPATLIKLATLEGHTFQLQCTAPELDLFLIPESDGIRLCGFFDADADTRLAGSASEFLKLATATDPASALINGQLALHGDSNALISLQQIGKQLDIDWESPLARVFGDIAGHQLGRGLRHGFRLASQAAGRLKRQLDDYLVEESDLLPPRYRVEGFYREVDQLAMRTERLEARLQKLRRQRQQD